MTSQGSLARGGAPGTLPLTDAERQFIAQRGRLMRSWPLVGGAMVALLLALAAWLYLERPLLANPGAVMRGIEHDTIASSSLALMAGMLPVTVLACLLLALAIIAFGFAAFHNEKKYLKLLARLDAVRD